MVSPSDGFSATKVEVLVSSSAVSESELGELVVSFLERNRDGVTIDTGWAPNPPPQHLASKLAMVSLHARDDSNQVYWLWRENAEPEWNLVEPSHWSVVAAQSARWVLMELPPDRCEAMLRKLPIEVLRNA